MARINVRYFFFQAEDGIRDDLVTGVQTCALPIYRQTSINRASTINHGLSPLSSSFILSSMKVQSGYQVDLSADSNLPLLPEHWAVVDVKTSKRRHQLELIPFTLTYLLECSVCTAI